MELTRISSFSSEGRCEAFAAAEAKETLRLDTALRVVTALFVASLIGIDIEIDIDMMGNRA
jgi:uncharacterized protein (UPF0254 family)